MLFLKWLNRVLLEYLRLDGLTTLLYKCLSLSFDREWRHFAIRALVFLLAAVNELKCGVLVEMHTSGDHAALGAENGTLTLRPDKGTLVLVVHRTSHDHFVPLRWLEVPDAR